MTKFSKIIFIFLLINFVRARSLWSADLPEITKITLEKGQPIQLRSSYQKLQLGGLTGTIYSDSLSELQEVTELRLCRNNITTIEDNALCASKSVKTLELDFYGNTNPPVLKKGTFENCDNIEELLLKFDSETTNYYRIDEDALENLVNLKKIYLQGYNLRHLSKDILKFPNNSLTTLYLSIDNIHDIDANTFENFANLEELGIIHNRKLERIPLTLFKNTPKLQRLVLRDNGIQNLTWDEFEGLDKLEDLAIGSNQITSFDADKIAQNLPNLKTLDIALNPPTCKRNEAFVNNLKSKLENLMEVTYKFDPGYYDSCEEID